jgi:hypothetical protein
MRLFPTCKNSANPNQIKRYLTLNLIDAVIRYEYSPSTDVGSEFNQEESLQLNKSSQLLK